MKCSAGQEDTVETLKFWSHRRVNRRLCIVTEGYSMVHRFTIGVIEGDRKVLVIDAGMGMAPGLREYIEQITGSEKPILCACTHGHPDHVGSACLFDEAYLSSLDYPRLESFALNPEVRLQDLEGFALGSPEVLAYCREHYLDNRGTKFSEITDGQVFDLGGVSLEAVALPGHSDGHFTFFNRDEGYVFTGDGINADVHLKKLDREGLLVYAASVRRFMERAGERAILYPAHLPAAFSIETARDVAAACEEVAEGRTQGDPPGETIFGRRAGDSRIRMHYVHNTCIVYNRELIGRTDS